MNDDLKNYRDYLLGKSSEEETERIDLAILAGAISDNDLAIAENELIEEYLEGALDHDDRIRFREHFLATDARRRIVDETRAMRLAARVRGRESDPAPMRGAATLNVGRGVFGYISDIRRSMRFALAAAVLIVAGLAIWYWVGGRGSDLARLETRYAELNRRVDPSAFPSTAVRTLFESRFRSGGEKKMRLAEFAGDPLFLLAVPRESTSGVFDLSVERNGKQIFTIRNLSPVKQEVRAIIPREIASGGPFVIRLDGSGTNGDPIRYEVSIE